MFRATSFTAKVICSMALVVSSTERAILVTLAATSSLVVAISVMLELESSAELNSTSTVSAMPLRLASICTMALDVSSTRVSTVEAPLVVVLADREI